MTSVYMDADYLAVYKQKKKIFGIFWAVTGVYAIFCIAWWIFYMGLPYADPQQSLPKACVYVVSVLYVIFAYLYLSIPGSRIKRYFKLMSYLSEGMKNEEKNYFYVFEKKTLQKDNIDVWGCIFETWSKKKQEWLERIAYFDTEKPLPDFKNGDFVQYIVQSNFIVQYDVIKRGAIEFELEEETEFTEE